jgi:hypothetical protein
MSEAHRQTRRPRPRRTFDRSIALARYRWEILRRTSEYRTAFRETCRGIAATLECTEAHLSQHCLKNGGILERVFGEGFSSAEHYDQICARFGLTVLMHPYVAFSDDEMAAFPVFADAPRRQPVLKDRVLLRRVAMKGGDISRRAQRRIFARKLVETGPFQPQVQRIHLDHLDTMLAVFDAHTARKSFARIAQDLGLSIDQVKRAWRVASVEIDRLSDFETHLKECAECQKCLQGRRDRYCPVVERRIGLRSSRGVQLHATLEQDLDLLNARHHGQIPARRSFKSSSSTRD